MRRYRGIFFAVAVVLVLGSSSFAADANYVGYKKCKGCHSYQFKAWKAFKHAKASEVLKEDQRKDPACMKCHGTGAEQGAVLEGVQCEACHGPGSLYKSPKIMSKSKYKKDPEGQRAKAVQAGLVLQEEKVCLKCHGQDRPEGHPPAKPFNYKEAYPKVAHKKKK
jgi:hypothetical protein